MYDEPTHVAGPRTTATSKEEGRLKVDMGRRKKNRLLRKKVKGFCKRVKKKN